MEYNINFEDYLAKYTPLIKEKKDNTQIDFNTTYSNLDWNTPLPTLDIETETDNRVKFSDLFASERQTPASTEELNQHYTGQITNDLQQSINKQLNKPYRLGGGHDGNVESKTLDCSGFVSLCFKDAYGIDLNGTAQNIYNNKHLSKVNYAQPGDIIFFRGTDKRGPNVVSHVGIVTAVDSNGNPTKMAHASARQHKKTVEVDYNPNYWNKFKPEVKRVKA